MANRIQHLRGSDTEHSTYTGAKGEISLVTDTSANRIPTGELRIHDGSTAGGLPVKLGTSSKPLTDDIYLASGTGINFSAYATSGNPSSNLLDDYEEGTWDPLSSTQADVYHARYTKVGNLVTINCSFSMKTGQSTQTISLPFVPLNDGTGKNTASNDATNNRYAGACSFFQNTTNVVNLMLYWQGNQGATAYFISQNTSGNQTWLQNINDTEFNTMAVSFTYQTS